jgi:peptidyl-prolyl cis-trans isomerase C
MHSKENALRTGNLLILCFLMTALGCRKQETAETAIARVDDQTLTMETIRMRFDSSQSVSEAQLQQYIQRWLTDEILYREAVRRGLDRTKDVTARLEDIRKQLAINALLDQEIYNSKSLNATEKEISDFYESHKDDFILANDVALVSYVLFRQRDAATAFRNSVLRGTAWPEALRLAKENPSQAPFVLAHVDSVYHTQASLYPAELWRVAGGLNTRDPSFPINTGDGYYVLATWKFMRQGQRAELRYVEEEIRGRIAIERRKRLYDAFLENLRAQHAVEVFVHSAVSDTVAPTKRLD